MKILKPTTKFKRDLKKFQNKPEKIKALLVVLDLLSNERLIPFDYYPHHLDGIYKDCMECHIQSDYLLIWFDNNKDIIELVRLGSHSELFK